MQIRNVIKTFNKMASERLLNFTKFMTVLKMK